jgi:hypothetical protein
MSGRDAITVEQSAWELCNGGNHYPFRERCHIEPDVLRPEEGTVTLAEYERRNGGAS